MSRSFNFLQRVLYSAGLGFNLGALAGLGETVHLVLTSFGMTLQPLLVIYAMVVDGIFGLVIGALAGLLWQAVAYALRVFTSREIIGTVQPVRQNAGDPTPTAQVTMVWRGAEPAAPPARPGVSRRAALRLGIAAASVGALGVGTLAFSSCLQRSPGQASGAATAPSSGSTAASPATAATPEPTAAAVQKPNVLLLTLDTLRADQLGVYGHPYMKTPNLDAIGQQGARFDLHMIQEPQTNPSHASMFTGMYPSSSGVRVHMVDKLPSSLDTLSSLFGSAGYTTAGLYSWMSFDSQYCGFERGFQTYQNVSGKSGGPLDAPGVRDVAAQYRVAEQYLALPKAISDKAGVQQGLEWSAKGHADLTTDSATAQLQILANRPFFMWVHYFDPHYPYVPPPPYDAQYDSTYTGKLAFGMDTIEAIEQGKIQPNPDDTKRLMSLYQGAITFMDAQLGRLFGMLDRLGLTSNTIVAVTGDHGEAFGEHAQLVEGPDYFHPHDLFNTEQRVPLLLRWPAQIKPGIVVKAPTQAIDIFPTLLDLAGIKVPAQSQASSLLPLLNGSDSGATRMAFGAMQDYVFTSVTVPGWKLVRNNVDGSGQLYDLGADPNETRDVTAVHPDLAKQLNGQAQSWMKTVGIA